ncbi:CdaR family transcriptional regulator [Conexibacter sp. DBS9H8]|uniref:PucR family transcriptional regulator n=1 Tax=Conexibacter sp. DBS9H8 TaxID=2937801 RepID=UPI00200FBD88|nr:helix-turn-helix domain-containing protein [Conexibacter sp. DBS9H8]
MSPIRLVEAALDGLDLTGLVAATAAGCGRAVSAVLPDLGPPRHAPEGAPGRDGRLLDYAAALRGGAPATLPDGVAGVAPVRIGGSTVGVIAAFGAGPAGAALEPWLEAAAAAAAVIARLGSGEEPGRDGGQNGRRRLLHALESADPAELGRLLERAAASGVELRAGAIGVCALGPADCLEVPTAPAGTLVDAVEPGRVLGLLPAGLAGADVLIDRWLADWRACGADGARSAARTGPGEVQGALWEAALLAELAAGPGLTPLSDAQGDTYRLLVGLFLHTPEAVVALRAGTVEELERYDALHDTELAVTLAAFLAHDGSTTDTAEALGLHRHTVGYRLSRIQEVAGLSPYDSEGRERLSLGLKADRILAADRRRRARWPAAGPGA